jgi:PEP-CTERM motif
MRYFRSALLALFALCMISGAAFADDIHVVFDPTATPPEIGNFNLIQQTNTPYLVSWVSCGSFGVPSGLANQSACLLFLNETGGAINDLNFQFTANTALAGQTVACNSIDEFLTSNTCGSVSGELQAGEPVSVDFFGGQPIGNFMAFFFGETGVSLADAPPITLTVPTPEPGTLVLLLAGFAVVAFSLLRKSAA